MRLRQLPLLLLALGLASTVLQAGEVSQAIEARMSGPVPKVLQEFRDWPLIGGETRTLYAGRDFEPVWLEDGKLTKQAAEVLSILAGSGSHGLRTGDYLVGPIETGLELVGREPRDADSLARVDLAMTISTMRYIKDLHQGRFSPAQLELGLSIEHRQLDLATELRRVLGADDPAAELRGYAPQHQGYDRLREQLAHYRKLAAEQPWKPLDDSKVIKPGDSYKQAEGLRERLRMTGDLQAATALAGPAYDDELVEAVERFQERHGLGVDGILGKNSFAQLNRTWDDRADQIALGLERWRWIPDDVETNLIVVVVPAFALRAIDDFHDPAAGHFDSAVIVGKSYSRFRTPIFTEEMRYLDFRPYWNIPRSIVRREIVPHLDEPGYLDEHEYEIVASFGNDVEALPATVENIDKVKKGQLELRQRPGPKNALGEVKFIFPNEHNVYLHSTPAKGLFARARRDFSHGCIRVGDPVGLAEWVLSDQPDWDRAAIQKAMDRGSPTRVMVSRRIPVYILYTTAFVSSTDGKLYFFEDIYGLDGDLANALGMELELLARAPER